LSAAARLPLLTQQAHLQISIYVQRAIVPLFACIADRISKKPVLLNVMLYRQPSKIAF
jgi:hypothetical protein